MTESHCKQAYRSHPGSAPYGGVRTRVFAAATGRAWAQCAFNRLIQTDMVSDADGRLLPTEVES